jgi:tetratricopeptide (TPR) repeat protein
MSRLRTRQRNDTGAAEKASTADLRTDTLTILPNHPFPDSPMFPHDKLDWQLTRLDKRLAKSPDDSGARLDYASACLSKAWWHDGGEVCFNDALTQARRILQRDPANPGALVVAGASLVSLGRIEPGASYLDEALRLSANRADVHLALAEMHRQTADLHQAVRECEIACRQAPKSWEPHHLLAQVLWERAQQLGGLGRLVERSQFHTVRALQLGPAQHLVSPMRYHLGISCLHTGRFNDAHKLFYKLLDDERHRDRAQYYLGLVSYQMGKYKNAVLYLRQHLNHVPDNPRVLSRLGLAYLQLGEITKARETCNRALAIDPSDVQARWTLGCALVEEAREDEATRAFKSILEDEPDNGPAFDELVRIRCNHRDLNWLQQALEVEVRGHDRLPQSPGGRSPRKATRARIDSVLRALGTVEANALPLILGSMKLTEDEGLRFALWEAALEQVAAERARQMSERLQDPGSHYSAINGQQALALADRIPEQLLTRGLDLDEEHLRRAAVERHGPAANVTRHRERVDDERRQARAWQAQLLLAIGAKQNRASKSLLRRWANEADDDLGDAARAGLTILGDEEATLQLQRRARARGASGLADALLTHIDPPRARFHPRPADATDGAHCATCGRRSAEAQHLLLGGKAAICDACTAELARERRQLLTADPEIRCSLCDKNNLEAKHVFVYRAVPVCSDCLGLSLSLAEREQIDTWLASV